MKNIIQLVILTLALSVGVFAQFEPNEPVEPTIINFIGDQSVPGEFVDMTQKVEGNSFVLNGNTKEYKSTLLTIAFDYNGLPDYNTGNGVSGGAWNLAIYSKGGEYKGSVYGVVTTGNITWSIFEGRGKGAAVQNSRNTRASLKIIGGTGDFFNIASSEAQLTSVMDLSTGATDCSIEGLDL